MRDKAIPIAKNMLSNKLRDIFTDKEEGQMEEEEKNDSVKDLGKKHGQKMKKKVGATEDMAVEENANDGFVVVDNPTSSDEDEEEKYSGDEEQGQVKKKAFPRIRNFVKNVKEKRQKRRESAQLKQENNLLDDLNNWQNDDSVTADTFEHEIKIKKKNKYASATKELFGVLREEHKRLKEKNPVRKFFRNKFSKKKPDGEDLDDVAEKSEDEQMCDQSEEEEKEPQEQMPK